MAEGGNVEFHFCVSVNGDVTSRTYGHPPPAAGPPGPRRCWATARLWPVASAPWSTPALQELRRRHQGQQRVARSLPVVVAAVTTVVAASTSARFRRACLGAMQVEDTPALVAATRRSLADVTRGRLVPCASCDTRRGSLMEGPRARRGRREEEEEEEEEDACPQSSEGQAWWQEAANQWMA
ncbi:type 2 DNA topoisomerase 6 subunit B-like [Chroicocephalus ridibundus]|uniref:type 2 DNA topoisomerase 6 subunit B-like n=1 Tax=Chroicocephalus ridibundus TaxID=1192867 RepID=UPI002FDDE40D